MSLSDPIGDMLARIKNAQVRNHSKVSLPSSKFKAKIADVLKSEGYIIDYEVKSEQNKSNLHISLKYGHNILLIIVPSRLIVLFVYLYKTTEYSTVFQDFGLED